jgi:hypothetical protein
MSHDANKLRDTRKSFRAQSAILVFLGAGYGSAVVLDGVSLALPEHGSPSVWKTARWSSTGTCGRKFRGGLRLPKHSAGWRRSRLDAVGHALAVGRLHRHRRLHADAAQRHAARRRSVRRCTSPNNLTDR